MNFLSTDPKIEIVKSLDLSKIHRGELKRFYFLIVDNGIGLPVLLPVIVAKGKNKGHTLGFTASEHGNELNGIKVIHKMMAEMAREIYNIC